MRWEGLSILSLVVFNKSGRPVYVQTQQLRNVKSGNTGQGSFYTSGPLIDGLLGVKLQGQYSHRGEDKIINGFNRQIMASGGATVSLTQMTKIPSTQNLNVITNIVMTVRVIPAKEATVAVLANMS